MVCSGHYRVVKQQCNQCSCKVYTISTFICAWWYGSYISVGKIPKEVEVLSIHDILLLGSCTHLELCQLVGKSRYQSDLHPQKWYVADNTNSGCVPNGRWLHSHAKNSTMPSSSIQPKTDWRGIKKLLDYTYVYKTSMLENSKEYRLALLRINS